MAKATDDDYWDIREDNTTPETWAYLERPDDQIDIPFEEWVLKYYKKPDDTLL